MNRFKKTLKILTSAFITMFVVYGMYGIFASAEDYNFEKPALGLDLVKALYHSEMNDYFNEKIGLFLNTKVDDENSLIPLNDEKCGKKNVSSYCVAMGALDMYYAYAETLDEISPTILHVQSVGGVPGTVASLFSSLSVTDSKVAKEKAEAMKVMDLTISTYNELRLALPVHLQYKLVIEELYGYINNLKKLRFTLYSFPGKFINSSSQSCK